VQSRVRAWPDKCRVLHAFGWLDAPVVPHDGAGAGLPVRAQSSRIMNEYFKMEAERRTSTVNPPHGTTSPAKPLAKAKAEASVVVVAAMRRGGED
jgi:hypothetical protein